MSNQTLMPDSPTNSLTDAEPSDPIASPESSVVYWKEHEVAKRWRRSTSAVKRLRLSGKLPYLATTPVLIAFTDVLAYEESIRTSRIPPEPTPPPPRDIQAEARAWALRAKMKFPRAKRKPS